MTDHANELRRHARKILHPQGETPGVMLRAADEIECLRAKVERMEQQDPLDADSDVFRSAFEAALKAGNWPATRQGDGYRSPSTQIAWGIAFSTVNRLKLYLAPGAQPEPSVPREAIDKMLTQLMDIAVSNGANSVSMPDEYVEVAAWLCGIPTQPAPSVQDGWLRAIDEALVTAHIGVANAEDTYEQAKAKLDNLIGFHVDVATDPAVNGGYKLVPIEPTQEMIRALIDGANQYDSWKEGYRDMLAAAQEAKP